MESGLDRRTLLALQLAAATADEDIWLDLHDLYQARYFDGIDNVTQLAANALAVNVSSNGKSSLSQRE